MLADLADPDAPARGAQALLNEPRLAAAVFWERHPELLAQSLTLVRGWPGVDAGWKEALLAAVPPPEGRSGPARKVELTIDTEQQETLSLTAFRRRPWPTPWGLVDVRQPVWEGIRVPPAAASKGTAPGFYRAAPCRRSLDEQHLLTP